MFLDMITAIYNNDKRFGYIPVEPNFDTDNGKVYLVAALCDTDNECANERIELGSDIDDRVLKHPEHTAVAIAGSPDTYMEVIVVYDNDHISDELDELLTERVIQTFFKMYDINTRGKVKAVIKRGQELFENYMNNPYLSNTFFSPDNLT